MIRRMIVSAILIFVFTISASASSYSMEELKEFIPSDLLELVPGDVFSEDVEKSADAVAKISGFSYVLKRIFYAFTGAFGESLKSFYSVFGILVIGSSLRLFGNYNDAFDILSSMCTAALVFSIQYKMIESVEIYLGELCVLMGGIIPMMSALYAAGGNLSSAAVNANGMLVFLAVIERVCIDIILPIVKLCYALSIAQILCKNVNISGINKLVNKTAVFVLGFVSTLAAAVLSYQSILAQGADSTASKIVRFSLGALVPIVGGAIGDSVKTLFSGMLLVKNTLGVLGVVLIFLLVLPPLVKLFLNKLMLGLSLGLASFLGADTEEKFFSDISGVHNLLIAVCAFSSLMFLVALGVFMRTGIAAGV